MTTPAGPPKLRLTLDVAGNLNARGLDDTAPAGIALELIARNALALHEPIDTSFYFWQEPPGHHAQVHLVVNGEGNGRSATIFVEPVTRLPHDLTNRELDVLTLLVGGLSNAEIARRLWTSVRTITTHADRILRKLAVSSRTAASALALEQSLVKLPIPGGTAGFDRLLLGRLNGPRKDHLAGTESPPAIATSPPSQTLRRRELVVGATFPLTGPAAVDGLEMFRASELAIEEINATGGVGGRRLRLLVHDVDLNSAASVERAFRHLTDQNVDALASGYVGHQEEAHRRAAEYGAPYLNAATLNFMVKRVAEQPDLFGHSFQICPSDVYYGPGFIAFLTWLRDSGTWHPSSNRLAVLRGSWQHGDLGFVEMVTLAEASGWVVEDCLDRVGENNPSEWTNEGLRLAHKDPAAVLIGCYLLDDTIDFIRAFRRINGGSLLYSLYTPSLPEFRNRLGPMAEGILWATTTGTYSDSIGASFARRFAQKFGKPPGRSHAGIAYDRIHILAAAWARVSNPYDFDQVSRAVQTMQYRGVNGAYSFANPGQSTLIYPLTSSDPSISQAHLVFQVQDGKQRILWPAPYGEAPFRPLRAVSQDGSRAG